MANITKGTINIDANSGQRSVYISELKAGEALSAGDLCYVYSDGTVKKAIQTNHTAGSIVFSAGFAPKDTASGDAVTLLGLGTRLSYSTGMTPGLYLFSGSVAGILCDTPYDSNDHPVALVVSATDIVVVK